MKNLRRVKIVATAGPSLSSREQLKKAISSGLNVLRLNFSHGKHSDFEKIIKETRALSDEMNAPVAILQDLQGPKIRVGQLENDQRELVTGESVVLQSGEEASKNIIPIDFPNLAKLCKKDQRILLDDGLISLSVTDVKGSAVHCHVDFGGVLKPRKGVNIPGANLPIEALTEKDLKDLEFGLKQKVDYVALSFVRSAEDLVFLKNKIKEANSSAKVIAKIEMQESLAHLKEIIELSDAIMVARGDLAIEVGHSRLPSLQKLIIQMANDQSCPVITATQMLDSMVAKNQPTRAEVTDVANAVLDGSDALMLSQETAVGAHPSLCISVMAEIILEVERTGDYFYQMSLDREFFGVPEAVAASACLSSLKLDAKVIVCLSTSGVTATMISAFRPKVPIIAVTRERFSLNPLELAWGIKTMTIEPYASGAEAISKVQSLLLKYKLVEKGDKIIVTLGRPVETNEKTNTVQIVEIKKD